MKIRLQHDERDCGATCLCIICDNYGLYIPIAKSRLLTKTDRNGTNLYGLIDGATKLGFIAEALSGSPQELLEGINNKEISFPFIAHTVSQNAILHYIVVFGIKNGKFIIADPARGKYTLTENDFFDIWTGYIATFEKSDTFQTTRQIQKHSLRFFQLLHSQVPTLTGILFLSMIVAAIGIIGAFVFQIIMDSMGAQNQTNGIALWLENHLGIEGNLNLTIIFASLIILYILYAILQIIRGYLIASVSRKLDISLSLSYYNHLIELPISSIQLRNTGEYLSRFSDISNIRQAISGATVTLLFDSLMVLACGGILAIQNPKLFGIALIMVIIYAIIVLFYRKPIERRNRNVMEQNAHVQSWFKESVDGIETLKASVAEIHAKNRARYHIHSFINAVFRTSILSVSQDVLAGLIEMVGTVSILWTGFSMVLDGKLSVGALITFYALLAYFTEPIKNLIELQPMLQTATVALDRLNDVMDTSSESLDNGADLPDNLPVNEWKVNHLNFRYGNEKLTLENVSLVIQEGEKIALVGESGSGKSTLAKLFLRFYEPESGEIFCDGNNIQTKSLLSLRRSVAYVSQNTFFFSDTIKNNLKLANPTISDDEIVKACQLSHIHNLITTLPMGYDTPLDENASNLSGGQKQRLAIARALLQKPKLLILDEATSQLDSITEARIKDTIFNSQEELTCIIIAHRLSTIQACDRIYVMENGKIVENGEHKDLLKKDGLYANLWKHNTSQ